MELSRRPVQPILTAIAQNSEPEELTRFSPYLEGVIVLVCCLDLILEPINNRTMYGCETVELVAVSIKKGG